MINSTSYYRDLFGNKEDFDKLKLYGNITLLLDDVVAQFKDYIALRWKEREVDYYSFNQDVGKLRHLLIAKGIKKGDHVGTMFRNEYDFVVSFFAIVTLGAVASIMPSNLANTAIKGLILKFDLKMIIYNEDAKENVKDINNVIKLSYEDLYNHNLSYIDGDDSLPKDTPACIVFTGGTTGSPKGALLSHINLCRGALNGCYVSGKVFHLKYVSLIPFTHVFGLVKNLLSNFVSGSSLYMVKEPSTFVKEMIIAKPEVMVLTPALARLVLNIINLYGKDAFGPDFKDIIAGGAAVPPELVLAFKDIGIRVSPGYGLTESANLVSGNGSSYNKPASVGIVYPEQEVKIVDGEILIKGDNIFLGYYKDLISTQKALVDGWLHTGDLGRFDEDGFLYIIGRKNNLIVLPSGLKVSPEEIEAVINRFPFIQDCVVYYDKDKSILVSEIYPNFQVIGMKKVSNHEDLIKNYVFNEVNNGLESHAKIGEVIFRKEDFIRSPAMKIIREH